MGFTRRAKRRKQNLSGRCEVVAALYGGNIIGQVANNGQIVRAPSAVQINFGVRVDLLSGMGKAVPVKEFLKF